MKDETILIIGAKGQLGKALKLKYPGATAVDSDVLDITDQMALKIFEWFSVKIIINAAAYTNVDGAETDEGRIAAWKVNAVANSYLAELALEHDITLVHISTDYVFDGANDNHKEDEPYSPLSVYGSSKAAGDIAISILPKHYILRTSWVIGDGNNFVRTMIGLAQKNINPIVVNDQIGRLTFTTELVRAIDYLLEHSCPFGVYNVTNSGNPASWADVAREIFKIAGYNNTVTGITTAEYYKGKPDIAPRPLKSVMDLDKLHQTKFDSRSWQEDLKQYIKKELEK
jgi:dTDP-4-dehydrorhamnose 3,5-epimerase/reductase